MAALEISKAVKHYSVTIASIRPRRCSRWIRKAVNLLDGIDFENQEELHAFNVIYETLLNGLQSAGRSGEFYTPRAITQFLTEKVNPELDKITADLQRR